MRQAMGYIDEAPSEAVREELIKTLQSVTEGKVGFANVLPSSADVDGASQWSCRVHKGCSAALPPLQIYVEIERARLTKRLAGIKEAEGATTEAADILQEVAVVRAAASATAEPLLCSLGWFVE